MATQKHIWAYIGIVILVTWLANGVIPELQAGNSPIPDTWAWLVRSLVPALVAITVLLPSVVQKPPGVPDVPIQTTVTVTPPTTSDKLTAAEFAGELAKALDKAVTPHASSGGSETLTITRQPPPSDSAPALTPTVPPPAIPDPTAPAAP